MTVAIKHCAYKYNMHVIIKHKALYIQQLSFSFGRFSFAALLVQSVKFYLTYISASDLLVSFYF